MFLLGLRTLLHSLGNASIMDNYDCCDRWLPEASEPNPDVLLLLFSRLDSPNKNCSGAVGARFQPSIVGINFVGAGIARGKAAAHVMAGAKGARIKRINLIVVQYTRLCKGSKARYGESQSPSALYMSSGTRCEDRDH